MDDEIETYIGLATKHEDPSVGLRDLAYAVELLVKRERQLLVTQISRLELKPDDVLLLRVGDPATGMMPSVAEERRLMEMATAVLRDVGLQNRVSVLCYNYALQASTIRGVD